MNDIVRQVYLFILLNRRKEFSILDGSSEKCIIEGCIIESRTKKSMIQDRNDSGSTTDQNVSTYKPLASSVISLPKK